MSSAPPQNAADEDNSDEEDEEESEEGSSAASMDEDEDEGEGPRAGRTEFDTAGGDLYTSKKSVHITERQKKGKKSSVPVHNDSIL